MAREITVATLAQVPPGTMKRVEVEDEEILLFNLDGEIHAVWDVCPHKGAPLSAGQFYDGCIVMCPLHAWEFDVRTGECYSFPEWTPLRLFEVRVEDDRISVVLPSREVTTLQGS